MASCRGSPSWPWQWLKQQGDASELGQRDKATWTSWASCHWALAAVLRILNTIVTPALKTSTSSCTLMVLPCAQDFKHYCYSCLENVYFFLHLDGSPLSFIYLKFICLFGCTGSSLQCMGFLSSWWAAGGLLWLQCTGFSLPWISVAVTHGLSCPAACGIFPDQ